MANDVIITPATGLVEFKDNNVLKGSIYESAGDIVINPVTGSVVLGDGTPANILVGGVGVPVNITLQGGGSLSSNAGTLGVGVNGDTVNFTVTGVTYNWPTTLMRTADYTATDILTRLKTVDGLGSGLDADLLDGYTVGTSGSSIPLLNTANTWSATQTIPTLAGNTQITGGLTISGSVASGAGDMGGYRGIGTNLILKGDSVGRSGIFFESEKDGVNINHSSDYGFIQFHPYGLDGSTGESNRLVIGVTNDLDDYIVLQAPGRSGLKYSFLETTSGSTMPLYTVWHEGNDGAGSGLDADLLDGLNSTAFAQLSGATFTGAISGTSYTGTGATFNNVGGATHGQIRLKTAVDATGYGVIHRHDGADYYLLLTANNDANGSWTTARPFVVSLATGSVSLGTTTAASLTVTGDLTVNGTTTTINSTTLTVDDKNIELGSVATPTDATADGGGITLKGATDKTFNWVSATGYWTANQSISAPRFVSTVAQGTAPLIVTSTTLVTNLNADLLDGLNSATANTASTIVARDASGNFAAGTITATLTGSASSVASAGTVTAETLTADAPAGLTFRQAYSNGYPTTYGNVISLGGAGHNQIFFGWSGTSGASADNYIRSQRDTGDANWSAWAKIWTDVNDGTGSGLDADLLDGNDSTYFTNATNLAAGTIPAARMPALTGDITTTAGAVATTLATVNSNVGSFGSASSIPVITVNAKGLITAVSTSAVSIPSGSISVTGGDLTLSGTTGTAITNATLATVNSNVGSFGSATSVPVLTVNAKGLVTAVSTATVTSLPTQTGNTGKYLTTDGTSASWTSTTAAAGGGIYINNSTISTSYTIPTGQNGFSVGPVTVASGNSIAVSSGQRWVII